MNEVMQRHNRLQCRAPAFRQHLGVLVERVIVEKRWGRYARVETWLDAAPLDAEPERIQAQFATKSEVFAEARPKFGRLPNRRNLARRFGGGPVRLGFARPILAALSLVGGSGYTPQEILSIHGVHAGAATRWLAPRLKPARAEVTRALASPRRAHPAEEYWQLSVPRPAGQF